MSGGPYGRGKAPERACRPLADWPEEDHRLWQAACAPADLLSEELGIRSTYADISNRKTQKGYGRWLTYVRREHPTRWSKSPAARITPPHVKAYVEHLGSLSNSTATILSRLHELHDAAKVMGPDQDWSFINKIAAKVRSGHRPARDKLNLKLSDALLDLGLDLIDKATSSTGLRAAILYRDGLVIALLALVPLRRRNLAGLRLGKNLIELNGSWLISLPAEETKTRAPLELDFPELLTQPLATYLQIHRPLLASLQGRWSKPVGDALWVSKDGSPMTQMAIYDRIRARTKEAFGTAINPHLFRDAAATTMAIADPEHVRISAPLLGHRSFTTTERYYQQATGYEAQRAYHRVVLRKSQQP
jgi:integrase/recombinase XerD